MYKHVLAAVGLGLGGVSVAQQAFRLARLLGSQVTLLHVLESSETQGPAEVLLRELPLQARLRPVVRLEPVTGSVADTILRIAKEHQADLILLGNKGELSPVAQAVAANPNIPVQLVPSEGPAAEGGWGAARREGRP